MKKAFLLTAIVALVLFAGYRLTGIRQSSQLATITNNRGVIRVGAMLPLTGGYAEPAEEMNKGALIAIDDARRKGIIIEYVAEDDQFQPSGFVNAARKLLEFNKVDIAITPFVTEVKPTAPLFNQAKIPLLSMWDNTSFMKTAGKYIFTMGFSTEANGEKMAEYAYKNLDLRRVAVIYQGEEWSELISSSFAKKFQGLGGAVPLNERLQLDDRDFRTLITKAKNLNVDGIYFPLNANANSYFLIQAGQLGFKGKFMTGDAFIQSEIDAAGQFAEGVYFTDIYAENLDGLIVKYKLKYNKDSSAPTMASFGYDAINVAVEAYKISTEKNIPLRDALTMVNIKGVGSWINMNGGQYSDRIEKIYQIVSKKSVEIK